MRPLPSWSVALAGLAAGAVTIALLPASALFHAASGPDHGAEALASTGARYACPMMDFIGQKPGDCPVCGMQMTKVVAGELSAEQTRRMGLETSTVTRGPAVASVRAYGTAEYDNRFTKLVIPRVAGRIVQRFDATFGCCQIVEAGAPVIALYSPEVIAAQGELQAALKLDDDALVTSLRERRDDHDELLGLQVGMAGEHGSVPLASLLATPTVYTLDLRRPSAEIQAGLPLAQQRNFTILSESRAELTVPAGEKLPAALSAHVAAQRPSELGLTYVIGPMAIRSEGGKRTQYVMFNAAPGASEVDIVRAADERLRAAISSGELTLPAGASYRWVGRYEQKIKADRTLGWVIAVSFSVMVVLIFIGTRSWLITAVIVGSNATVTTAGGFVLVWLWGAQLTTVVTVGFLVLLGVMFNDGILLGTYIQKTSRTPPRDMGEVNARIFEAGLRRRRPAIMTNATTMLSLVPVLWATGRGAELMAPMMLPVIGGMIFDIASLFSVPVFYAWYWERRLAREAKSA